jgi:hypothetical protein
MSRPPPPPPTKFGAAGIQAKTARAKPPHVAPLPPPTQFGAVAVQRQAQANAGLPNPGDKSPARPKAGIAPPAISWPVAAIQTKRGTAFGRPTTLEPQPKQFGSNLPQSKIPSNDQRPSSHLVHHRNRASYKMPIQAKIATSVQQIPEKGTVSFLAGPWGRHPRTIQRQTHLTYAATPSQIGTSVINGYNHARVQLTGTETTLAAAYSGYASSNAAPGYCKHYVSYDMVKTAVFGVLSGMTLTAAVAWLESRGMPGATTFQEHNGPLFYAIAAQPQPAIPLAGGGGPAAYSAAVVNTEVDDFIKNLANDPRNLYYRTASSGDNWGQSLDDPLGHGVKTLLAERTRLENYRGLLTGLGLAV